MQPLRRVRGGSRTTSGRDPRRNSCREHVRYSQRGDLCRLQRPARDDGSAVSGLSRSVHRQQRLPGGRGRQPGNRGGARLLHEARRVPSAGAAFNGRFRGFGADAHVRAHRNIAAPPCSACGAGGWDQPVRFRYHDLPALASGTGGTISCADPGSWIDLRAHHLRYLPRPWIRLVSGIACRDELHSPADSAASDCLQ